MFKGLSDLTWPLCLPGEPYFSAGDDKHWYNNSQGSCVPLQSRLCVGSWSQVAGSDCIYQDSTGCCTPAPPASTNPFGLSTMNLILIGVGTIALLALTTR